MQLLFGQWVCYTIERTVYRYYGLYKIVKVTMRRGMSSTTFASHLNGLSVLYLRCIGCQFSTLECELTGT